MTFPRAEFLSVRFHRLFSDDVRQVELGERVREQPAEFLRRSRARGGRSSRFRRRQDFVQLPNEGFLSLELARLQRSERGAEVDESAFALVPEGALSELRFGELEARGEEVSARLERPREA